MKRAFDICNVVLLTGILLTVIGLFHFIPFEGNSDVFDILYMRHTVRKYIFFSSGGSFIFLSIVLRKLIHNIQLQFDHFQNQTCKLEIKMNKKFKNKAYDYSFVWF